MLLQNAQAPEGITKDAIRQMIAENGFYYDNIAFEKAVLGVLDGKSRSSSEGFQGLGALIRDNDRYYSAFPHAAKRTIPSRLERMWLKTVLSDARAALFLSKELIDDLNGWLADVPQLFLTEEVLHRHYKKEGDPYSDANYRVRFAEILSAIRQGQPIQVTNVTPIGEPIVSILMPYRLEYSQKDDVFRVSGTVRSEDGAQLVSMRLSRIRQIEALIDSQSGSVDSEAFHALMELRRMREPAVLELSDERNGFERFLHFFSNYTRTAKSVGETRTLRIELDYYDFDENELIISLLAMGPIVRVISPDTLRSKVASRLRSQMSTMGL